MGRRRLLLLVLPALAVGCGGHASSAATTDPAASTLGSASLDLAIAGNAAPTAGTAYGTTVTGTGSAQGSLTIVDSGPVQAGTVTVRAELDGAAKGGRLGQLLVLEFDHASALAVGASSTIDGRSGYAEEPLAAGRAFDGQDGATRFWQATGGTVTVAALSGPSVTLRLTNVTFAPGESGAPAIALSGTVAGTIAGPVE